SGVVSPRVHGLPIGGPVGQGDDGVVSLAREIPIGQRDGVLHLQKSQWARSRRRLRWLRLRYQHGRTPRAQLHAELRASRRAFEEKRSGAARQGVPLLQALSLRAQAHLTAHSLVASI